MVKALIVAKHEFHFADLVLGGVFCVMRRIAFALRNADVLPDERGKASGHVRVAILDVFPGVHHGLWPRGQAGEADERQGDSGHSVFFALHDMHLRGHAPVLALRSIGCPHAQMVFGE
jgi:hypothetical protein